MPKIKHWFYEHDGVKHSEQYHYYCPGCKYIHAIGVNVHHFNGDFERPTFTPSLLQSNPQNWHRCHSYITDGMIRYLNDCWHELKGKTVELPDFSEWPEHYKDNYENGKTD